MDFSPPAHGPSVDSSSPFEITLAPRKLVVRFREPLRCVSWAIVNGGFVMAPSVEWYFLRIDELRDVTDPRAYLAERIGPRSIGLLTSRREHAYVSDGSSVVATVGLSNALRVGDAPAPAAASTINALICCDERLTDEAALEALAIATEAKTAAVMDSGIRSVVSGRIATGTGTDCLVLACATEGPPSYYSGKHTHVGHRIGDAVYKTIAEGITQWQEEFQR